MVHFGKRSDASWFGHHGVPSMLACVEDAFIGREDLVAEEVVLEVLPRFFGSIAFRRIGRDGNEGNIVGNFQGIGSMPGRAVYDHRHVDMGRDLGAYFIQKELHHGRIRTRQNKADCGISFGAERAEDIGVFVARIDGYRWTCAFGSPAMGSASFLPDAAFVLRPELQRLSRMGGGDFPELFREFF